ncbi:MAG: toprim domain-containing protein [Methylococcaceae bacterium]
MNTYEILDAFKKAIQDTGSQPPEHINADGKLHRCHIEGQKQDTKNGAYFLHLDGKPNGYFEDFATGIKIKWKAAGNAKPASQAEREDFATKKAQAEQQQMQKYEQAAITAQRLLDTAKLLINPDHPYLIKKRVKPYGVYRLKTWHKRIKNEAGQWVSLDIPNVLLIPLIDLYGKVWNVQAIFEEAHPVLGRDKDFLPGGRLGGLFHVIGQATNDELIICEGFATGASLHDATGFQVLCAMSAGNLLPVAQAVRAADPKKKIVLAADNDDLKPGNPGVTAAKKAARAVGGFLAIPPTTGDFNDHTNQGGGQ